MVNIIQGLNIQNGNQIPYLKLNGMIFNIEISEGEIYILSVDGCNSPISLKKWESCLSKIRGYYAHEDKFNELRTWYEGTRSNLNGLTFDTLAIDETVRIPTPDDTDRHSDMCESSSERRTRRLRDEMVFNSSRPYDTPTHDGDIVSMEDVNNAVEFAREVQRDRNIDDECGLM